MRSPSVRIPTWFTPLSLSVALFVVGIATPPCPSPDGVEMAATGAASFRSLVGGGSLAGFEPFYWPPLFPLLSGALALLIGPAAGAVIVSLVGTALVLAGLTRLAERQGAGLLVPLIAVCVPTFRHYAMLGDGRSLATAALVWAWIGVAERRAGVGFLLAAAWLTRPEAGAAALLMLGAQALRDRWAALRSLVVVLALVGPYLALLSWAAGRPVFSPRDWMSAVTPWLAALPMEWLQAELAAGTWGSPLRAALSRLPPRPEGTADVQGALAYLPGALSQLAPAWLWALSGAGLVFARPWRMRVAFAAILCVPALLTHLAPQARDEVLQVNNLRPLLAVMVLLAALGAEGLTRRLPYGRGLAIAAVLALGLATPAPLPQDFPIDSRLARAAAHAVKAQVPRDEAVAASLVTAPWVLRSDRARRRLPPPWGVGAWLAGQERTRWVLVSWLDLPGSARSLRALQDLGGLEPVWSAQEGDHWVILVRVTGRQGRARPLAGQMPSPSAFASAVPLMRARE